MGNPFSKNGAVTKLVEAIPGGGWITAPVHAAAGNPIHAAQAAIAGFGTAAGFVMGGPVGAIVAGAGTAGLKGIFDQLGLSDDKKQACVCAASNGQAPEATRILLEAGHQKIAQSTRHLSADAGGRRCLKSVHGSYLRANEPAWAVDMVHAHPQAWEQWYIEDWGGKVVLKGRGGPNKPGQFLRGYPDGRVDLTGSHPQDWEKWQPFKNEDGSWSFLNAHGKWLSANSNGSVYTVDDCNAWEHFWLETW